MTDTETTEGIFTATLNAPTSKGAWANGANTATSIPNATTLEEGAPTTYDSFMLALDECTEDECEIYFNFHVSYFGFVVLAFTWLRYPVS